MKSLFKYLVESTDFVKIHEIPLVNADILINLLNSQRVKEKIIVFNLIKIR